MMDDSQIPLNDESSFSSKHLFLMMIILSILIALALVLVSMTLYSSSGAAQLDLSRPGYKDVRSQVINSDNFQNYSSTGSINQTAITEFETLYDQQAKKIESVDAFGGDPLSPDALGINVITVEQ